MAPAKTKKRQNSLRKRLKLLFKDKLFGGFVWAACILCLVSLLFIAFRVRPSDFAVPLRYSTFQGFDALGAWYRVYTYGVFALLVTAGNLILAAVSLDKSRIASFFLILGTIVVNIFALIVIVTLTGHLEL